MKNKILFLTVLGVIGCAGAMDAPPEPLEGYDICDEYYSGRFDPRASAVYMDPNVISAAIEKHCELLGYPHKGQQENVDPGAF